MYELLKRTLWSWLLNGKSKLSAIWLMDVQSKTGRGLQSGCKQCFLSVRLSNCSSIFCKALGHFMDSKYQLQFRSESQVPWLLAQPNRSFPVAQNLTLPVKSVLALIWHDVSLMPLAIWQPQDCTAQISKPCGGILGNYHALALTYTFSKILSVSLLTNSDNTSDTYKIHFLG